MDPGNFFWYVPSQSLPFENSRNMYYCHPSNFFSLGFPLHDILYRNCSKHLHIFHLRFGLHLLREAIEEMGEKQWFSNLFKYRTHTFKIICIKILLNICRVKHFKNSQDIKYVTDHDYSCAMRSRNSLCFVFFLNKARAQSSRGLQLGGSSSIPEWMRGLR